MPARSPAVIVSAMPPELVYRIVIAVGAVAFLGLLGLLVRALFRGR